MKPLTATLLALSVLASPVAAQTLDVLLPSIVFTETTIVPPVLLCTTVLTPVVCTEQK